MHNAGLELTKLTYTWFEDNLIRRRGDRKYIEGWRQHNTLLTMKSRSTKDAAGYNFHVPFA